MAVTNPEAEAFFLERHAHDEVAMRFLESVEGLAGTIVCGDLGSFGAPYAATADVVFGGASSMNDVYFRLSPEDRQHAFDAGATSTTLGPDWAQFVLFAHRGPKFDLHHWARLAHRRAQLGG